MKVFIFLNSENMLIDGKAIAREIVSEVAGEVKKLPFQPLFCDIMVGSDPVSLRFVAAKGRAAERAGIGFLAEQFPETVALTDLLKKISELNARPEVCGLIVQLPLPGHLDRQAVLDAIDPAIDADCLTRENSEKFYAGQPVLEPPTAAAIMRVLESTGRPLAGCTAVVIGRGQLVGKPAAYLLGRAGALVASADKTTPDLEGLAFKADVIIAGAGSPGLLTDRHIRPGSVVIDAGTSETEGGIAGDVAEGAGGAAAWLAAVPGGVGPVTVAMLLKNVVRAAKNRV